MLRKIVCALFVLGVSLGIAMGDELKGKIVKVGEKKVTFQTYDKKTKTVGEAKDYDLSKDVKVYKMEKKTKVDVAEGLKAEAFSKIDAEKGLQATIVTSD